MTKSQFVNEKNGMEVTVETKADGTKVFRVVDGDEVFESVFPVFNVESVWESVVEDLEVKNSNAQVMRGHKSSHQRKRG